MTSEHELVDYQVRPNYRALGPRFGRQVRQVAAALDALDAPAAVRELDELGSIHIEVEGATETLEPGDLDVRRTPREGFGVAEQDGVIVAIATEIDDELALEGLARELVHATQGLRRDAGLEVSDRIHLWLDGPATLHETLAAHETEIAAEVLAVKVNEGTPPEDAAEATPTLNGVPVKVRLTRT